MKLEKSLDPVVLPKLGESITEATVVTWLKQVGEFVAKDEPLLEVATDKINSEIPAPTSGTLVDVVAAVGDTIAVGDPLCYLEQDTKKVSHKKDSSAADFSPAVLRLMQEHGLSFEEVREVEGSGREGRVTKNDLQAYIARGATPNQKKDLLCGEAISRVPMTPLRKTIAHNMVRSFYQAPHASLVAEVDVTSLVKYIKKYRAAIQKKHQVKLTITSFVAKALTSAIHFYPLINSSLEEDTIVMKKFVNLGIAVSIEEGVIVPVIKQANQLSLLELSRNIAELANKARSQKLSLESTMQGSITLTNFGMAKAKIGVPIIRYPEVAILGMGAIEKKVVVLEDDTFGIRSMMHLSLTFDHRVIDGMYGCGFLQEIKTQLEKKLLEDEALSFDD